MGKKGLDRFAGICSNHNIKMGCDEVGGVVKRGGDLVSFLVNG